MDFILMNKNHKILEFNYDEDISAITTIKQVYDQRYLPYSIKNQDNENLIKPLNNWLSNRFQQHSFWYKQLARTTHQVDFISALFTKSYGLSLSDQYWIKPSYDKTKWEDINFYSNDFQYKDFIEVGLESRKYDYNNVDVLYSPDITTGGELGKCWVIGSNKERLLYKSTNTFWGLEPINEYLASLICEILELSHANYNIQILSNLNKEIMVSVCPTFCNEDIELIPFYDLDINNGNYLDDFKEYSDVLEKKGIKDAKVKVSKMFLLDVIISNNDRHLGNYGIVRDSNTLEWIDVAPIYDSGRSMLTYLPTIDINYDNELWVFNNSGVSHKDVLDMISDLKLTLQQLNDLEKIPQVYKSLLIKYREYTNIKNDDDIELLVAKLEKNIREVVNIME